MPESTSAPLLVVRAADVTRPDSFETGAGAIVAVGVPVFTSEGSIQPVAGAPGQLTFGSVTLSLAVPDDLAARRGFTGAAGEALAVAATTGPVVVFLGCGDPSGLDSDVLRSAAASLVRQAGRSGAALFVLSEGLVAALPPTEAGVPLAAPGARRAAQALAEGAVLAAYSFTAHKTDEPRGRVSTVVVAGAGLEPEVVAEGVRRGTLVAAATCFARDLVNEPPSSMSPALLADAVRRRLDGEAGVRLEVWDEPRIVEERLGGLLGVARGSAEPPRLLWATYEPADPVEVGGRVPHVVLVGKGITFDSGGLSLKTPEGMTTMKTDMSGAAAVMAAVSACGGLGVRVRVTAIAPVTENMPGGRAIKPG
ncbi:MAG TPA: M17 family peptidase N-terminal domain-containing protein, partial [Acidimicrobiales bacterium]|nr:M17 family peptidase N-terminal domain-containing protein [Acidimicrobiales bacterium]